MTATVVLPPLSRRLFFASPRIARYTVGYFLRALLVLMIILVLLLFLLQSVEGAKKTLVSGIAWYQLLLLVGLRLPMEIQEIMPFVVLIASAFGFQQLARHRELIVMRAMGLSPWAIIGPVLAAAFVLGVLIVGVWNPLATTLFNEAERLDNRWLRHGKVSLTVGGMWFRDEDPVTGSIRLGHCPRIFVDESDRLHPVTFLLFDEHHRLQRRLDASEASIEHGQWKLRDVVETTDTVLQRPIGHVLLPTHQRMNQLRATSVAPRQLSFWQLPGWILRLEYAGLLGLRHRVYWYQLLSYPWLFTQLAMVGSVVGLGVRRMERRALLFAMALLVGFLFYIGMNLAVHWAFAGIVPPGVTILLPLIMLSLVSVAMVLQRGS
jgi:lipopolysaccharide export system permease protein